MTKADPLRINGDILRKQMNHIMPNEQFAVLMTAVLKEGKAFRFQASGFSMDPFIKDGDILTLINLSQRRVHLGDVLSFNHPNNGKLTIHRVVIGKQNKFFMKPDNSVSADGWINLEDVIGIVRSVERRGNSIRFGLGWEKWWIAQLSRRNALLPTIRVLWLFVPAWIKRQIKGN